MYQFWVLHKGRIAIKDKLTKLGWSEGNTLVFL